MANIWFRSLRDQRGQVMVFVLVTLVFLFVVGGLAVDWAYYFLVHNELERSMDAAALAGAGKLKFSDVELADARSFAHLFAANNAYRIGTIDLNTNVANAVADIWPSTVSAPVGDIVLGIFDPSLPKGVGTVNVTADPTSPTGTNPPRTHRFEPSTDGTIVNAVMCRYKTTIPTSFLRMWGMGMSTLTTGAYAIATSNPPATPPENSCTFPMGLSSCPFQTGGVFSSQGCGIAIKFATSNGQAGSTNTAAWINNSCPASTGTPSAATLISQITAAASGVCPACAPSAGTDVGTNNGMVNSVFQVLKTAFTAEFAASLTQPNYVVENSASPPVAVYTGHGWELYVPVISTGCNADGTTQAITGPHTIAGWTRMVLTQVWDTSGTSHGCAVVNDDDLTTRKWCHAMTDGNPACSAAENAMPGGCESPPAELQGGSSRSVFGYYECGVIPAPPTPNPAPRAAIATKLRLVE